jgi:WD40 repeat protein
MKNKNDKRLIGAIEHIDDKFIESAAKRIKPREAGISERSVNKTKIIKQVALLAACLVLLGAAVPLAGRLVGLIPELFNPAGTANESNVLETNENDPPEEYFTAGDGFLSYPSYYFGVEYDGCWIHKSGANKDSEGSLNDFFRYLYKYDPVAKTSTSLCIKQSCKHTDESCPVFVPVGWNISSISVFDDWCLYMYSKGIDVDSNSVGTDNKVRLYNMKTGESKLVAETVKLEDSLTYPVAVFALDGKVYLNFAKLSIPDMADVLGFTRYYVSCYDPQMDAKEFMCNVPGDVKMVGITNKRIFYAATNSENDAHTDIWTSDYSGENYRKMANFNFVPMFVCGTIAYGAGENNTVRVYDLATDSTSTIDFGNIQYVYLDSGELGFTTTSRIEEYNKYRKDPDAYIAKNYPGVTDPDKISKLKSETELKLNCKVDMQFYLTDARGRNQTLVFEGENIDFKPYRRVGDHIIGYLRKASKYEMRILDSGFAALSLKTGEFEMIPAVKFD